MPRYKVLAKFGKRRRETYDYITAKTAKEAIKKAKAQERKQTKGAPRGFARGKDWKAVKMSSSKKRRTSRGFGWF